MGCHSWFDIRNHGLKPEEKQFFKKFICKFSIDYYDQSSIFKKIV